MKNRIICGLVAIAFFLLGTPLSSDANPRHKHGRGHYKKGYKAGYRHGYYQSQRTHRYYAPRPVYRGQRYAHPARVHRGRPVVYASPRPVKVWVPARKVWGPRGYYIRPGHYAWR